MAIKQLTLFIQLFQEFADSYPYSSEGLNHRASYEKQRQQGRRNFAEITTALKEGEDITELVRFKLLPHTDTPKNRQRGAWIHRTESNNIDLTEWFQWSTNKPWEKQEYWSVIAREIYIFVTLCITDDRKFLVACKNFSKLPNTGGFKVGKMTPILNALKPDNFLLINQKSTKVINYLSNTKYTQDLTEYPYINLTGHNLILELAKEMQKQNIPAMRDDDLFDMFCYWLVDVKKYNFPSENINNTDNIYETNQDEKINRTVTHLQPEYTLTKCSQETCFPETKLAQWIRGIDRKKQAIFQGSPGTGKTFLAQKLAQYLTSEGDGFWEIIQFHPAYTYEDFIQGIRPQSEDGKLIYPVVPGRFLKFCQKAALCQNTCVLIIDEINRANLSQVFGELMYLLEYRDAEIFLAGSEELFSIPENVRIIGTMNTADRSIALVDHALRRRFAFITLFPNYEILRQYHEEIEEYFPIEQLVEILEAVNREINDPHYQVGVSFFLRRNIEEEIQDIWQMEIEPYLEEYFFAQPEKVDEFRWDKIKYLMLE
ncbi:AAA family ATPase [Okeania sp.]|uniref:McrB family protein n=1 Tax=Okeania sp. TaxID=3100323 RepID=UPI002B4B6F7A|nr:AAA family ATPase [Okeania sp.]MEB3343354.1 AAA family ATPase [Okeania sp.]